MTEQELYPVELCQERVSALRTQLKEAMCALDDVRNKAGLPAMKKKYEGKCFKLRNSYSCPGPNDYWWMYAKVNRVVSCDEFVVTRFQADTEGKIIIEPSCATLSGISDNYTKITKREYTSAFKKVLAKLTAVMEDPE